MSATNSAIFSTSRSLYSLATNEQAPKRYAKLSNKAVPNVALQASSAILFIVVILNYIMPAGIFEIVSGVSTINFIFVWIFILATHIAYRKANPAGVAAFTMPGFPFTSWLTMIFFIGVLIILLFIPATRPSLIISVVFFLVLFIAYGLLKKQAK